MKPHLLVLAALPFALAALAILLTLPMIGAGYVMDDNLHTFVLRGGTFHCGPHGPWDLYRFSDGGPELKRAMEDGLFPSLRERGRDIVGERRGQDRSPSATGAMT